MKYVIVGGGVAGMTAALDLSRRESGEIELYTDERHPYYYRPQLTEFFAGNIDIDKVVRRPLEWYAGKGINVHLETKVIGVEPETKSIVLEEGSRVAYDKLLLALGSLPFVPPIKGAGKLGVRTWRTLDDTLELKERAATCGSTIVIGGGLLGLEGARGFISVCSDVTVLEMFPRLLPRQLDEVGSQLLQNFVESLGIRVVVGAATEEILGGDHAMGVRLKDGREFAAPLILVSAGVRCNAGIADKAGIEVGRGVIVNAHMETSEPGIYAAGDVAVFQGHTWAIAPIAQAQARVAAANMAGEDMVYEAVVPSTTLKVIGIDVASIGVVNPEADADYIQIPHFNAEAKVYKKIVLKEGVIVGAIVINEKKLAKHLESLISEHAKMTLDEARSLVN
ncbi:MAG: NAD(P)/FAD-dependent oxidoreductase [Anaerolineae bacterium]|nr:NAD(P)/FAD-dependent oxidoreductase [Anaerolineae bacterium]